MYEVLARKWRPKQFDEVVGQQAVTQTLRNALTSGRIHQAFVFAGPRCGPRRVLDVSVYVLGRRTASGAAMPGGRREQVMRKHPA